MDYDDLFDEEILEIIKRIEEREQSIYLEQALISKKENKNNYSVERDYINSKKYHDKFLMLPVNERVAESLYKQAGRLLEFMDGKDEERLIAISARTGEFLVDNFAREGYSKNTAFTEAEHQKVLNCLDMVVLLHNHSRNGRPSAADIMSYLKNDKVKLSLIICHDGDIFAIGGVKNKFVEFYEKFLSEAKTKTNNIEEAKILATTKLYNINNDMHNKDKLFDVQKL